MSRAVTVKGNTPAHEAAAKGLMDVVRLIARLGGVELLQVRDVPIGCLSMDNCPLPRVAPTALLRLTSEYELCRYACRAR